MTKELQAKYDKLKATLEAVGNIAIAYSGGIDSSLLVKVAHDVLDDKCIAFTASSDFMPMKDVARAQAFCEKEGIKLTVMDFPILDVPHVKDNPTDRCYYCKYALFKHLKAMAGEQWVTHVAEGTNLDDDGDYRPGRTALRELHTMSPLYTCGFTKDDIRALAKELGIEGWDQPSSACLASRFAYGTHLTPEKLQRVEKAEEFLHRLGFGLLRVRVEYETARIELAPADIPRFLNPELMAQVEKELRGLGYAHVSLDLTGYRKGSMNEGVKGI